MDISTDQWIMFEVAGWPVNATIVFTWAVMALLALGSWAITARLGSDETPTRWQIMLEVVVTTIRDQIGAIGTETPGRYLPFIGTLFLFIATANLLMVVPGYSPPTGSLSTTTALAVCVLIAVPVFGIARQGPLAYLKRYVSPSVVMLPFNVIAELSRTLALAVRLYGNVMSGTVIGGIIIGIAPFFFPILLQLLGLLTGFIQAYIFAVLAMVHIAAVTRARTRSGTQENNEKDN